MVEYTVIGDDGGGAAVGGVTVKTIADPLSGYTLLAVAIGGTFVGLVILMMIVFAIILCCKKCVCFKRGDLKVPAADMEKSDTQTNLLPSKGQSVSEIELEKLSKTPTNGHMYSSQQNGGADNHRRQDSDMVPLMIGDLPSPPEATDKVLGDSLQRQNSWGNRNTSFRLNFEEKSRIVENLRRPNNNTIPEREYTEPDSPEPELGHMSGDVTTPLSVIARREDNPIRMSYSSPDTTSGSLHSPTTPNTVIYQPTLISQASGSSTQVEPLHIHTLQSEPKSPGSPRSPDSNQLATGLRSPGSHQSVTMRSPLSPSTHPMPESLRQSINVAVAEQADRKSAEDMRPKSTPIQLQTNTPNTDIHVGVESKHAKTQPQSHSRIQTTPLNAEIISEEKTPQVNGQIRREHPPHKTQLSNGNMRPGLDVKDSVDKPAEVVKVPESPVRPTKLKIPPPTLPKPKTKLKAQQSRTSIGENHYDVPRIHTASLQSTPSSETASSPSTPLTRQQYNNARRDSLGTSPAQSPSRPPWERPTTKVAPWDKFPGQLPPKTSSPRSQFTKPPMQKSGSMSGHYARPVIKPPSANMRVTVGKDSPSPLYNQNPNQPRKVATVKPNSSMKHSSYSSFMEHLEGQAESVGNVKVTPPTVSDDKSIKIATYIEEENQNIK